MTIRSINAWIQGKTSLSFTRFEQPGFADAFFLATQMPAALARSPSKFRTQCPVPLSSFTNQKPLPSNDCAPKQYKKTPLRIVRRSRFL
ncbi:MAG TPA: hypothetical protein VE154_01900, partial [Chthoniobacterales bacterium]|nr:hypothetical protein [Chthoniobacterales bacterium]